MFIGRKEQIQQLEDACCSNNSELLAVYGRRRVGKTELINYMFTKHKKDCNFFRFTGSYQLSSKDQLTYFIEAIYDWFSEEPTQNIDSWAKAFIFLKRVIQKVKKSNNKKFVIFLDEVPWIDKKDNAGFIGALGTFWNDFCKEEGDIILIVCGSNSSWINNKVFEDSEGPLYQRLTDKIEVKPFDLKETIEFLKKAKGMRIDSKTATELYMVFGGIPKYLELIKKPSKIYDEIDRLFFTHDGFLNKEYSDIFDSLFNKRAAFYTQVLDVLSKKQSGYTQAELARELKIPNGRKATEALEELVACGFVKGLTKFDAEIGVKYIICDPYVLFHLKWVAKYNKNQINNLTLPHWSRQVATQPYSIWCGFAFETVCLQNIDLYLTARQTKGLSKGYSYWNYVAKTKDEKGAQIDILIEYSNNTYDIVECKFYNKEFTINKDYKENILNKIDAFTRYGVKGKYNINFIMLTTYGCDENEHYHSLNITESLTIDDLLK